MSVMEISLRPIPYMVLLGGVTVGKKIVCYYNNFRIEVILLQKVNVRNGKY